MAILIGVRKFAKRGGKLKIIITFEKYGRRPNICTLNSSVRSKKNERKKKNSFEAYPSPWVEKTLTHIKKLEGNNVRPHRVIALLLLPFFFLVTIQNGPLLDKLKVSGFFFLLFFFEGEKKKKQKKKE